MKIGDWVETINGARFYGQIIALDVDPFNPGALVIARHPDFTGVKHVYPLTQLKITDKRPSAFLPDEKQIKELMACKDVTTFHIKFMRMMNKRYG